MREKIIGVLKKYTKNGGVPADDASLFDEGYLDSFALPEMVGELERTFEIEIPDSDMNPRKFESIERIQEYVGGRV
jgi:acyl carrier protein